ncbi:N-acetylmuramoyl-L-alanine amidase [Streptomyces sp. NBC_01591]|uniref:N-acetylmuramoyl-L-alanine amidase n=1 Tax=Streptomyces sp. NBC_01591 TaxID=2975888 RepID=UPI002DD830E0|nr:N-acetylmuramoyl-L-alanine amidase [Streptomyces sp. NBC_01591]WSD71959.1 N-acetylmuramoyl-L-alanine amidase [Streptomyces sp. NBC_01591]
MANPLSAAAVLAALRAEDVRVVEVGNWRTHNRNQKGAWGPINGSIVHHTVTKGTAATVRIVRDGYSSLPGPLCHGMIAKDGRVHLVGWGRTNHAGGGDPKVLDQVTAESYGTRPTPPTHGNSDGVDGNARFYGWECQNLGDGKDPWPAAQYDAIVRVQAALCRAHKWSAKSVIGHLEWSSDKVDPRGFSMTTLRSDVAERLKHPASWSPGKTTPTPPKETPVSTTDDRVKALHTNLLSIGEIGTTAKGTPSGRVEHGAGYYLAHILNEVRQLRADVAALKKEA